MILKKSSEQLDAEQYKLFGQILKVLHDAGLLEHLVLVGSWCLYFYRRQYNNHPHIPVVRTMDIDILVPSRFKFSHPVDLIRVFAALGFDRAQDPLSGHMKLVHPELEIEFLTPDLGRGSMQPLEVRSLSINAQRLRYLQLLQNQISAIAYKGMIVRIPGMEAFFLHKLLIHHDRKNPDKRQKDKETILSLAEYASDNPDFRHKVQALYSGLPAGWRKHIDANAESIGLKAAW